MSGLATLRGTLAPVVVGHIPKELSRYVWYAFEQGAKFTGVISDKPKRSPLIIQGGQWSLLSRVGRCEKSGDFEKENRGSLLFC